MGGVSRLFPLPPYLKEPDPETLSLTADLPRGEPWGWAFARALFSSPLATRPRPWPKGLLALAEAGLRELVRKLEEARRAHPLPELGARPPLAAEADALNVLKSPSASALEALYAAHGAAPLALERAFLWEEGLSRVPLPPRVPLAGYARQLERLEALARRFHAGRPVPPTLLYGAHGSGKSTAVKNLLHLDLPQLRLIEVRPAGLGRLPELFERLAPQPQRVLLFFDDLAFDADDARYRAVKSLIEGSLLSWPENVWPVATTNQRNLLTTDWAAREAPDAFDRGQEARSLADRFGVVLTFPPFDKARYLEAVRLHLGRPLDPETEAAALRFAQEGRGFSGRTARHFALLYA